MVDLGGLACLVGIGNSEDGIHFHLPLCFLAPWGVAWRMDLQIGSIWIRNLGCLKERHVMDRPGGARHRRFQVVSFASLGVRE